MSSTNFRINISPPNLINVCVDERLEGEICGRIYHCYSEQAVPFTSIVELITISEKLFEDIGYPQASTKTRTFEEKTEIQSLPKLEKKVAQQELIQQRGKMGTFLLYVQFRQRSTWQGELSWMEKEEHIKFRNSLEFIKAIDQAI